MGSIKKVHGHGLLGISRGTSAAELHFCSWKSWSRLPLAESHTMMPAPGGGSEAADLMEMVPNDAESGLAGACALRGGVPDRALWLPTSVTS